jgi:hypothetical protein
MNQQQMDYQQRTLTDFIKAFRGKKIVNVRYMSDEERDAYGWAHRPMVIFFDDGSYLFPMSDDEGNEAGALCTSHDNLQTIAVI